MNFKGHGKNIYGVSLSKREQEILDEEIRRQIIEKDEQYTVELYALIFWTLRKYFGFGEKKLKELWGYMATGHVELREKYMMEDVDDAWLCERELKEDGIDIRKWTEDENANRRSWEQRT